MKRTQLVKIKGVPVTHQALSWVLGDRVRCEHDKEKAEGQNPVPGSEAGQCTGMETGSGLPEKCREGFSEEGVPMLSFQSCAGMP